MVINDTTLFELVKKCVDGYFGRIIKDKYSNVISSKMGGIYSSTIVFSMKRITDFIKGLI